jgi:peptide chain release factor 2
VISRSKLKVFTIPLNSCRSIFDIEGKKQRLAELGHSVEDENLWSDPEKAKSLLKERAFLSGRVENWQSLYNQVEDCTILIELAEEESDENTLAEAARQVKQLEKKLKDFSLQAMLDGEDDHRNAIVSINAGAGGTDAQDWVQILFRMYTRWCENKGYTVDLMDFQEGDEAGIKSVTLTVKGENAFGYLKVESGVHRLVRISPFNASGKRHTSFASVFVYPEIEDDIQIEIDENDIRIDTYRASGAGGQHVNKTSSAVRITHFPTNIVVQCQQEKSQLRNREKAMKVLRARLYQHEKQKQEKKLQSIHDNKEDIAWGSQIRSYVLNPYQMVKDHRVNMDIGNVDAVLDGGIDPFIEKVLLAEHTAEQENPLK